MKNYIKDHPALILILVPHLFPFGSGKIIFSDQFDSLDNWKPLTFKKIEKHTQYFIDKGILMDHI